MTREKQGDRSCPIYAAQCLGAYIVEHVDSWVNPVARLTARADAADADAAVKPVRRASAKKEFDHKLFGSDYF